MENDFWTKRNFKFLFYIIVFSTKNPTAEENIIVLSRNIIYVSDFESKEKKRWWRGVKIYITSEKSSILWKHVYRRQGEHDVGSSHLLLSDYVVLVHSNVNFSDESLYTYINYITTYAL